MTMQQTHSDTLAMVGKVTGMSLEDIAQSLEWAADALAQQRRWASADDLPRLAVAENRVRDALSQLGLLLEEQASEKGAER